MYTKIEWEIWLPELVAQSVLIDAYPCHLPSLSRRRRQEIRDRLSKGKTEVASEWQNLLANGIVKNRAELARLKGVSRACVTQTLSNKTK